MKLIAAIIVISAFYNLSKAQSIYPSQFTPVTFTKSTQPVTQYSVPTTPLYWKNTINFDQTSVISKLQVFVTFTNSSFPQSATQTIVPWNGWYK